MDVRIATRHRFATQKDAIAYMVAHHLEKNMGWTTIKHSDGWGVGYGEHGKEETITDRLRPIYEAHSGNRNSFIAAAVEAGVKKGSATTMWYNFKKESEA